MNQTSQYQFTPLLHTLTYALQQYQQKQHIDSALFQHPIKLAILEKQPNLCLSDFKHSVQAIKVAKEEAFKSHPFNKFNSGFYCILDKKWLSLNAKKESLVDSHENAHPYEPYFHFKEDYEDYRAQRDFLNLRSECQVIVITKWSLKIVNIGNTGYYGVVILMLQTDSRVKGVKFIQNVAGISSVLYEKSMKQMLQRLRLQDIRLIFSKGEDKRAPHSMFYYCQEQESKPKHRPHNILVADTHQKMLAFNPEQPYHLLTFGKVQGLNCLQRPLAAKQINQEKITTMNLENIQIFFNGVKIKEEKGKDQGHKHALEWSSDQESSQERQDAENSDFQMMIESDSSEGQDPLRNLYLKQFDQMKIA